MIGINKPSETGYSLEYCSFRCYNKTRFKSDEQVEKIQNYIADLKMHAEQSNIPLFTNKNTCLRICSKQSPSIKVYKDGSFIHAFNQKSGIPEAKDLASPRFLDSLLE